MKAPKVTAAPIRRREPLRVARNNAKPAMPTAIATATVTRAAFEGGLDRSSEVQMGTTIQKTPPNAAPAYVLTIQSVRVILGAYFGRMDGSITGMIGALETGPSGVVGGGSAIRGGIPPTGADSTGVNPGALIPGGAGKTLLNS